ncbi:acyl carrier protein [Cohaesibacter celericrescens]|jgi:acyl carrier protein|uniref:Acyl carrier protein n=1 Tax=Cohaesibacter celericrescens TaxID=2067669 RepID=A0A2N5XMK8_9HYPH|nr:acyl carrier protein [Cohaesibacter celericrescens]PLW75712.1 acyl carrier protein [Cohaesibacter celericrescens]
MIDQVRALFAKNTFLPCDVSTIADDADLYDAGLSSFGSVQLMLAIEETFDIELPETLLTRRTFASLENIAEALSGLVSKAA